MTDEFIEAMENAVLNAPDGRIARQLETLLSRLTGTGGLTNESIPLPADNEPNG